MSLKLITDAAAFAALAHKLQSRKELNESFISHPLRVGATAVALGHTNAEFIAACYLHDVIEDTDVTLQQLKDRFPLFTVQMVDAVSKTWTGEPPPGAIDGYYERICKQPGAPLLKMLDRTDNLQDMVRTAPRSPNMHKWARKYLARTLVEMPMVVAAVAHPATLKLYDTAVSDLAVVVAL